MPSCESRTSHPCSALACTHKLIFPPRMSDRVTLEYRLRQRWPFRHSRSPYLNPPSHSMKLQRRARSPHRPSPNKCQPKLCLLPTSRLQQHRGLLTGGAKSTRTARDWEYLAVIHTPQWVGRSNRALAASFEMRLRYPTGTRQDGEPGTATTTSHCGRERQCCSPSVFDTGCILMCTGVNPSWQSVLEYTLLILAPTDEDVLFFATFCVSPQAG